MMIYKNKQAIALLSLLLTLIVAACNKPEAKPPTNIEKDKKSDTDTVPKGKSGNGSEDATPAHSFAFDTASHKEAFTSDGTYTRAVVETNKPAGDTRNIEYISSKNAIATVDNTGQVTFVTQGTVTITATKALKGEYPEATARYTLYLTTKPRNKAGLVTEIKRATRVHGNTVDLNYIDTSAITDMSYLFSNDRTSGHKLAAFNGDISKWDVAAVTNMHAMFWGATSFNQNISGWNVARVADMGAMFSGATSFNQDISRWNVAMVTDMINIFNRATSFNQDISGWNVAKVTNMQFMFYGATLFKQNLDAWGERINAAVKANGWVNAARMFFNSGLASKLPSWCENVPDCKTAQS